MDICTTEYNPLLATLCTLVDLQLEVESCTLHKVGSRAKHSYNRCGGDVTSLNGSEFLRHILSSLEQLSTRIPQREWANTSTVKCAAVRTSCEMLSSTCTSLVVCTRNAALT